MEAYIQERIELEKQADQALLELANTFSQAARYLLQSGDIHKIREAQAYGRSLRGHYTNFMKDYARFDEAASLLILEDETAYRARTRQRQDPPAPAAAGGKEKKGTPKYERLKAQPGWPWLIRAEEAVQAYGIATDVYFEDQYEWAASGSFDRKAGLLRRKFDKWASKSASALHHLCMIAAEFQRPSDRSNGGRPGKQALAALIRDQAEVWQDLVTEAVEAILEAADQR